MRTGMNRLTNELEIYLDKEEAGADAADGERRQASRIEDILQDLEEKL